MKMYVFKNYEFSTSKFDFCSLVKKIINILKCLCKYYVRGIMAKPKTYIRQNGIRLLPHTTIQHLSVVVVHTHTLPFFPHPHVLFKCLLNPEKFKNLNSTFRCTETVQVWSFLRILQCVWATTTTTVVVCTLLWCGNSLNRILLWKTKSGQSENKNCSASQQKIQKIKKILPIL